MSLQATIHVICTVCHWFCVSVCLQSLIQACTAPAYCAIFPVYFLQSQAVKCITRLCSNVLRTIQRLQVFILTERYSSSFHNSTHLQPHTQGINQGEELMWSQSGVQTCRPLTLGGTWSETAALFPLRNLFLIQ